MALVRAFLCVHLLERACNSPCRGRVPGLALTGDPFDLRAGDGSVLRGGRATCEQSATDEGRQAAIRLLQGNRLQGNRISLRRAAKRDVPNLGPSPF